MVIDWLSGVGTIAKHSPLMIFVQNEKYVKIIKENIL